MTRLAGIIFAAVGFLIAIISVLNIVPGLTQTGVIMLIAGGLIIGLSFIDKPNPEGTDRMSTPETLAGIFYAPTEVFRNLRRHPRWLAAVLIMTALSAIYSALFFYRLTPERIVNYSIDKTLEMPMVAGNEDARKQIEQNRPKALEDAKNPIVRIGQVASSFSWQIILYAFLGGIFFLFAKAMGGNINFWQAFSAAVYAWFPAAVIRFLLNSLILFIKDPTDIHPILGQSSLIQDNLGFLVTPGEHPVIYVILSSLSLLMFYWLWLNATGLKNTGERVSSSTAWTATLTVFFVMLGLGVLTAFLFPSFMS